MLGNSINAEGATAIVDAVKDKPQVLTLCGIKPEETERNFYGKGLGVGDAILLAFDLRINPSLVKLECAAHARSRTFAVLAFRRTVRRR